MLGSEKNQEKACVLGRRGVVILKSISLNSSGCAVLTSGPPCGFRTSWILVGRASSSTGLTGLPLLLPLYPGPWGLRKESLPGICSQEHSLHEHSQWHGTPDCETRQPLSSCWEPRKSAVPQARSLLLLNRRKIQRKGCFKQVADR